MSFGYAVGDFLALTQLAWRVVENSRKACGAHAELTREATSLHIVLQRLEREVSKPRSILIQNDDNRGDELAVLSGDCNRVLRVLSRILEKYNALSDEERSVTKLWQRIRFGNGEMQDLNEIRLKVSTSTSAITLFLNLLSIGSQGRVEEFMESQDEGFKEMRQSLNYIAASLQAKSREGSILTSYAEDDKKVWKEFRRELIKEGFPSAMLSKHKPAIKAYVMELGNLGALDDIQGGEQHLESDEDVSLAEEASFYHSSNLQTTDNTQAAEVTGISPRTRMMNYFLRQKSPSCLYPRLERQQQPREKKIGYAKKTRGRRRLYWTTTNRHHKPRKATTNLLMLITNQATIMGLI